MVSGSVDGKKAQLVPGKHGGISMSFSWGQWAPHNQLQLSPPPWPGTRGSKGKVAVGGPEHVTALMVEGWGPSEDDILVMVKTFDLH